MRSHLTVGAIHQGFIEAALLEGIRSRQGPRVQRGTQPVAMELDEHHEYPVKVRLRHSFKSELLHPRASAYTLQKDGTHKHERGSIDGYGTDPEEIVPRVDGIEGSEEIIRAKYLIGTDGAHSWVRRQLPGVTMEGDSTNAVWGVIDVVPLTDWPDVRRACNIMTERGACIVIPRENNMIRLYIQFPDDYNAENSHSRTDGEVVCRDIMDTARKIFAPYTMDYKYCDWWTLYRVGQRVATTNSHMNRIFIGGDAVHTHSPKAGQGMNVSQQDTYNLAWKLAGVLRNQLHPSILETYQSERLPVAHQLMALDKEMAKLLTTRGPFDPDAAKLVHGMVTKQNGTYLLYSSSRLIASASTCNPAAANNIPLGIRLSNAQVFSQANDVKTNIQALLKSDGSWRLLVFAGDLSSSAQLTYINTYGPQILSLCQRYPPASTRLRSWLSVLLFHSGKTRDVEFNDFHEAYFPLHPVHDTAHEKYGIVTKGALVLVRPDQYVAWVGGLEDLGALETWCENFMLEVSSS
ncbi:hypothetical protein CERZMDRAFT_111010 [Cercospora zeae-maydis SCOH1-5]|uniref:FAD-binding domain-containing protein n=1 Tax=Cercospora zeae-maydis SCOH1-5 TaxID=717836 RepID=A0A6A6FL08_9PEZI|nr:hypothetical protein CERZMDRAFT_111010 [Cercospora zeae-maydis SCOH1-5]